MADPNKNRDNVDDVVGMTSALDKIQLGEHAHSHSTAVVDVDDDRKNTIQNIIQNQNDNDNDVKMEEDISAGMADMAINANTTMDTTMDTTRAREHKVTKAKNRDSKNSKKNNNKMKKQKKIRPCPSQLWPGAYKAATLEQLMDDWGLTEESLGWV